MEYGEDLPGPEAGSPQYIEVRASPIGSPMLRFISVSK